MSVREIRNPYDDSVIDTVPDMDEAAVRAAIDRADAVRERLASLPSHRRAAILYRAAELIDSNADALTELIARESAKPLKYARGETMRAVETFTFAAEEAKRLHGETVPMDAAKGGIGRFGYYVRVPVGIVGGITPFNFPINLVAHKVAPAIAAGCPIVLKPAPATPLSAIKLQELLLEAGLPEGAYEVVTGDADVGKWLTTDPRIAMISFTGSPPVARAISEIAGLRRTTFELGGNAATIIDADADIDKAVDRNVMGAFSYSGQVCISVQRLFVHQDVYDEFRTKFIEKTQRLIMGDPLDAKTDISAMLNDGAAQRVKSWIDEAVSAGATVAHGGDTNGRMFQPTILENTTPQMKVWTHEIFGPVVDLIPFRDFDEALHMADDSEFGLQAGVYTNDLRHVMRAVERLNVGGVIINDVPTFRVDHMPYGGNKSSGVGREGPRFAIEDMTTLKMVVIAG